MSAHLASQPPARYPGRMNGPTRLLRALRARLRKLARTPDATAPHARTRHQGRSDAADARPDTEDGLLVACSCGTPPADFLLGPRGGSAQNCQCPRCGTWYNLGWLPGQDRPLLLSVQGQRSDLDLRATAPGSQARH
jgi:hypothetical protein